MKKLLLALLFGLCAIGTASAQRVQQPTQAGMVCAYNLSLPTYQTGWFGYVQCDANGKLIVSGGGGGGGGGAITAAASAFVAGAAVDGWDLNAGSTTDVATTAGGTGTFSAKFRLMTTQLAAISTSANQTTTNTNIGAPGATVCATDTGSCSINALFQRLLQSVTTLNGNVTASIPAGNNVIGSVTRPDTRPVSGNITVVDSGSVSASGQNSVSVVTGTPTTSSFYTQAVNGQSTARVLVTGTWTGTLTFEGSIDGGTTWVANTARFTGTSYTGASVTANGIFSLDATGLTNFRVRATAAMTGTAVVQAAFAVAPGFIQVNNPIRFFDNVSGAQASIKAASTAPATTDTTLVVGSADGNQVTIGAKADNKSSATDTTPITVMSVLKQISASVQAMATSLSGTLTVASHAVTNTGTFAVQASLTSTTNAGAALVKGGVGVVNGGSTYNTVAASQTAQALTGGGGGATGDYLSHCLIQPTTTAAGTVTILDNSTVIFTFTTGTLSNLVPFTIPVGANSTGGAWKVTTGANETVTCAGKFT